MSCPAAPYSCPNHLQSLAEVHGELFTTSKCVCWDGKDERNCQGKRAGKRDRKKRKLSSWTWSEFGRPTFICKLIPYLLLPDKKANFSISSTFGGSFFLLLPKQKIPHPIFVANTRRTRILERKQMWRDRTHIHAEWHFGWHFMRDIIFAAASQTTMQNLRSFLHGPAKQGLPLKVSVLNVALSLLTGYIRMQKTKRATTHLCNIGWWDWDHGEPVVCFKTAPRTAVTVFISYLSVSQWRISLRKRLMKSVKSVVSLLCTSWEHLTSA